MEKEKNGWLSDLIVPPLIALGCTILFAAGHKLFVIFMALWMLTMITTRQAKELGY